MKTLQEIITDMEETGKGPWIFRENSTLGQEILTASLDEQYTLTLEIMAMLTAEKKHGLNTWFFNNIAGHLSAFDLPFTHEHLLMLINTRIQQSNFWILTSDLIRMVENYIQEYGRSPELDAHLIRLADKPKGYYDSYPKETLREAAQLRALAGDFEERLPLLPEEPWADAAIASCNGLPPEKKQLWIELMKAGIYTSASSPSTKWLKVNEKIIQQLGFETFKTSLLVWFPLVGKHGTHHKLDWEPNLNDKVQPLNMDILKGLAWLAGLREDAELAQALTHLAITCYKGLPGTGVVAAKVSNAAIWALGNMPGLEGGNQLSILKVHIKGILPQKTIQKALLNVARRNHLSADEIEEKR